MKIIDRLVNGSGEEQLLPATRREAFRFYGKEYFGRLVLSSAVGSLFFLPALLWLYVMNYAKAKTVAAMDASAPGYAAELLAYRKSFTLTTYGVLILLMAVFFAGLAGCFSLAKRMSMGERAKFSEFWQGIRQNGVRFLFFGAVFGTVLLVVRMNWLSYASSSGFLAGLFTCGAVLLLILTGLLLLYCMTQTVIYHVTFGQMLKNAFLLSFARFFRNLGIVALAAAPVLAVLLIPSPFQLIGLLLLSVFYPGFSALLLVNYCLSVYDRTINPSLGEEYVGRGLARQASETENN